jgi:hypothetical protein
VEVFDVVVGAIVVVVVVVAVRTSVVVGATVVVVVDVVVGATVVVVEPVDVVVVGAAVAVVDVLVDAVLVASVVATATSTRVVLDVRAAADVTGGGIVIVALCSSSASSSRTSSIVATSSSPWAACHKTYPMRARTRTPAPITTILVPRGRAAKPCFAGGGSGNGVLSGGSPGGASLTGAENRKSAARDLGAPNQGALGLPRGLEPTSACAGRCQSVVRDGPRDRSFAAQAQGSERSVASSRGGAAPGFSAFDPSAPVGGSLRRGLNRPMIARTGRAPARTSSRVTAPSTIAATA